MKKLRVLPLVALIASCATPNQYSTNQSYEPDRMQALDSLRKRGVSIDDSVVCADLRENRYGIDFLDFKATNSRLNAYFNQKGERITNSLQQNGSHYVLTNQGNVYEIGSMRVYSAMSPNLAVKCVQADFPTTIKKTIITPEQYNGMSERSKKQWDDDRKREDERWKNSMDQMDRDWKNMVGIHFKDSKFLKGTKCVTTTTRESNGSVKTKTDCKTRE